ncbi:energy transducer TonB [Marinilabilia salmonicolor]|jgi:TonB family protein|uniref:TonB family protein n=1 Tax=Marinilabilia salmonicolor TaxID=989 RepID=A0A2T0XHB6_9BACT|nr:energy transducer TonB [Marinilabilia salmonicolor]PRY98312.1 TonB family protein [Marinilabilia salmonicolor]RCW33886.1 TonB family protein [Marinilabilia salmonicolor]
MKKIKLLTGTLMFCFLSMASVSFSQSETVAQDVDKEAKFKGKPRNIASFHEKYMKYPDEARLEMIEGTVLLEAVVTSDGKLMEPEIINGVDPLLDSEALRLARLMQDWKPAQKNGQEVDSRVRIPVKFTLSEEERAFMQTLRKNGLTEQMPLFVIDDKIAKAYIKVPHYNVKSVRVLKGEKAVEKYGPDAQNGVVIITTKRGTPPIR